MTTGRLVEISPLGTGFIEDSAGARYGFHYSMLKTAQCASDSNWRDELEDRLVDFEFVSGRVVSLRFHRENFVTAAF